MRHLNGRKGGSQNSSSLALYSQQYVWSFSMVFLWAIYQYVGIDWCCVYIRSVGTISGSHCGVNVTMRKNFEISAVDFRTARARWKLLRARYSGGILKRINAPYTRSVGTRLSGSTESFTDLTAIWSAILLFVSGDSFLIISYAQWTGARYLSTNDIEFGDPIKTDSVCMCSISAFDWNTQGKNCFPALCAMISGG